MLKSLFKQNHTLTALAAILILFSVFTIFRLQWGLPTAERNHFYPDKPELYFEEQLNREYMTGPLDSFHPDEGYILNALSNMNPSKGDFNPRVFNYPTFQIYLTGIVLKCMNLAGWLELVPDRLYYLNHPEQMARMYLGGRFVCFIFGILGIGLIHLITCQITGNRLAGILAALSLSLMPLWVRDSAFMAVNIPGAALMEIAVLLSIRKRPISRWQQALPAIFFSGLAAGVKYPLGAIALLPIYLYWKDSKATRQARAAGALILWFGSIFFFLLTTPYAIPNFDVFLNNLRFEATDKLHDPFRLTNFAFLLHAIAPAFCIMIPCAFFYLFKTNKKVAYLLTGWLVLAGWPAAVTGEDYMRYWIPALPPMACALGIFCGDLCKKKGLIAGLIIASFVYQLQINVEFLLDRLEDDPRLTAAHWIEENIPPGSNISMRHIYYYLPPVNSDRYSIHWKEKDLCEAPADHWLITYESFKRPWQCENKRKVCGRFENPMETFPYRYIHVYPHDLLYTRLAIAVYCPEQQESK